jgi:hypothetical protein
MADKKVVFIAFAIEDERMRDLLKGQSLHTKCPIEFIDMSVKDEPGPTPCFGCHGRPYVDFG